jgi:hypothetical protein
MVGTIIVDVVEEVMVGTMIVDAAVAIVATNAVGVVGTADGVMVTVEGDVIGMRTRTLIANLIATIKVMI